MQEYLVFRNNLGQVDAINHQVSGASIPLSLDSNKENPLVIEFEKWLLKNPDFDISNHDPEPETVVIEYRVNKLLPTDTNTTLDRFPGDINYNSDLVIGLTTRTIDYFGLRVAQVYYQSLDTETLELIEPLPIIFERYLYSWNNVTKLPERRVKKIHFYLSDGRLSEQSKILPKEFYNVSDQSDITFYRRQSILNWLIARATQLGLGKQVKDYFALYKNQTDNYLRYGDCEILKTVKDSTEPWLDLDTTTPLGTVRNAIAICFNKAIAITPDEEVTIYLDSLGL